MDPNEKVGPAGVGSQHFVPGDEALQYEIYFENVATATAPAQEITVSDTLDSDLDWLKNIGRVDEYDVNNVFFTTLPNRNVLPAEPE